LTALLHIVPGGSLLFALVPLVVFGYIGWYYHGAKRVDKAFYSLKRDQVTISPPPSWVKLDILEQVFRDTKLERINLLDPSASADIASAFETNGWVKSVTRVSKAYGGSVTVDMVYRKPVAMVKVLHPTEGTGQQREGFLPVDAAGSILPSSDFDKQRVPDFLLVDIDSVSIENVSTADYRIYSFADVRVREALKVADFLEAACDRRSLGLQWISVRRDPTQVTQSNPWLVLLETSDKNSILWGHAPGAETAGEQSAQQKIAEIDNWLKQQRADGVRGATLDLSKSKANRNRPVSNK
jgi:hypothetical protein